MAASAMRVAIATGASLAVHLFVKSFVQAQHPALTLLLPVAVFVGIAVGAKGGSGGDGKAPPGPAAVPVFGNWLQVGNDLNHRFLAAMSARYGPVFRLRLGVRNLVVVSDPKLATEVLHTQGVEFGSRPRNVVFDIFNANGARHGVHRVPALRRGPPQLPGDHPGAAILALIVGKLVRSFEMVPPPGVEKLDVSEKGGQFSLHIAKHSVVAFHPISA
ncbi:hypothetical protein OsJ_06672 [Oryza sativa Japonica Group]|uniref:Uncharacterized protein n=1 Tax=Oryza sativa subsp. japonica TaxID=39947 RepID=B9EZX0_ORYSJ|nr:hypothetical protein OsJ_06672 [Oryza sativa Japonica Group]